MKRYIISSKIYGNRITSEDREGIEELFGSQPVKHFFLASPGYYGYGGYGSDYSIDFWILEDGRGVATSPYSGKEEFSSTSAMFSRIDKIRDEMIKECDELIENDEIDEEIYDKLMDKYNIYD